MTIRLRQYTDTIAAADITISDGYQGSATDVWTQNFATDQAVFGVPA